MTYTDERRPAWAPYGPGGDIPRVPTSTHGGREPAPLSAALTDATARLVWLDGFDAGRDVGRAEAFRAGHTTGYELGHGEGYAEGVDDADAERSAILGDRNRALVRLLTTSPDYAALCELRGEPERAEAQRSALAGNGVTR